MQVQSEILWYNEDAYSYGSLKCLVMIYKCAEYNMIRIKKWSIFVTYSSNRCTYYVVPLLNPPILVVIWANITQEAPRWYGSRNFLFFSGLGKNVSRFSLVAVCVPVVFLFFGGVLGVQIIRVTTIIGTLYTTSTSTLYNADWSYGKGRPDTTHWMPHVELMTSSWNGRQVKHPHNADCWTTHHPHRRDRSPGSNAMHCEITTSNFETQIQNNRKTKQVQHTYFINLLIQSIIYACAIQDQYKLFLTLFFWVQL